MQKAHGGILVATLVGALLLLAPALGAQARPAVADGPNRNDRSSPRAAIDAYLASCRAGDYLRAARALDVGALPPEDRESQGAALARQLHEVLQATGALDLDALSADAEGRADDQLPPDFERVASLPTARGDVDVLLRRVVRDEIAVWAISAATVARIADLHEELGPSALARLLPARFTEGVFLGLRPWQWGGLLLLGVMAFLLAWPAARLASRALESCLGGTADRMDSWLLDMTRGPLRLLAGVALVALGVLFLELPGPARVGVRGLLTAATVAGLTWLLLRLVDVAVIVLRARLERTGSPSLRALLPPAEKVARGLLLLLGGLLLLPSLGFDITGVLVLVLVAGLAVALATQRTVADQVAGLSLVLEQGVCVGEVRRWGERLATIEDIGPRLTRLRTLDQGTVSVPNAELAALPLQDPVDAGRLPLRAVLALRSDTTPEQVRWLLAELRRLLAAHPCVPTDAARVRLVRCGARSLDVEVVAAVHADDWDHFLALREELLLRVLDVACASGAGLARDPLEPLVDNEPQHVPEARPRALPARQAAD